MLEAIFPRYYPCSDLLLSVVWTHLMDDITNIGYLIVGFVFMLLIEMAVDIGRSIIWTEEHDRNLREKLRAKFTSRKEPSKLIRF